MAAAPRLDTAATAPATTPAVDRRQWWEDVQSGFSALLTEAAHPAPAERLAG